MDALTLGFGLGFIVALQLGPMSLFLVRSTLAGGWGAGLAVGAGIALVDAAYAAAGAAGAAPLLAIGPLETAFGLIGAAVILWLGLKALQSARRPREAGSSHRAATTPRKAFLTSLAATSANPATIVSWAAVFAAAGAAGASDTATGAALLVAGVGLGSLAWVSMLATGTAGAGRALGPGAIRIADIVAAAGLLAFGLALAIHSFTAA
jgi:putative LysE/RhtB family amino acid efflux pump